jgi:hypothetical protein
VETVAVADEAEVAALEAARLGELAGNGGVGVETRRGLLVVGGLFGGFYFVAGEESAGAADEPEGSDEFFSQGGVERGGWGEVG